MADPRPAVTRDDNRTAMTRVSDNRPPVYYDTARRHAEPPAVTAARQRHRAINEQIARAHAALTAEEIMPDPGAGMEWYRELDDQDAGTP